MCTHFSTVEHIQDKGECKGEPAAASSSLVFAWSCKQVHLHNLLSFPLPSKLPGCVPTLNLAPPSILTSSPLT